MRNYKLILMLICPFLFMSCEDWTQTEKINVETNTVLNQLRERDIKKWVAERKLQKAEDQSVEEWNNQVAEMYDKYWEAIREYKKSDHKIVYGWFGGWSATEGIPKTFLTNLPDSVDVVSIWGGTGSFEEGSARWEDLKYAQEVKGIKVLLCWQTGASGLGLKGAEEGFNERHPNKNSVEKAIAYAQELTKFIKDHNFNGYDIDWEPSVGNHNRTKCNNLYENCDGSSYNGDTSSAAPIRAFIDEMSKNFGPMQTTDYNPRNTGTMLLFDGQIEDMANRFPEKGGAFNYYLEQNYFGLRPQYSSYYDRIDTYNRKKHLFSDEFEMSIGGVCGNDGSLSCAERKAKYIKDNGYGGWAAYHIELEQPTDFNYVRKVIRTLNPRSIYNSFLTK